MKLVRRFSQRAPSQQGIALVAVLWIVAALSIVVASIGYSVRQEVRAASSVRQALTGRALGEAAIHLVLQDLALRQRRSPTLAYLDTTFRDVPIRVRVLPLSGLIDINNAPPALLAALFTVAGELNSQRAADLAAAAVETRSAKDSRGRPIGFEAPEDLLRVPGIDYTLYAKISALVTADVQGNGRVAPLAAPEGVLLVLSSGNAAKAAGIAADRESGRVGIDLTSLNGELTDSAASTPRFELQARVPLAGGSWLLVSRTVDFGASRNGVPWRTINTGYRFEAPGERS
jgi:general secretion pathway protein K